MWKRLRELWLPRARARAARMETPAAPDPPAPDPELIEKFANEAHELDAVRKSVEDAAAVSAGFWLSYLIVLFYIGIAAGAVTHRDLLLENPVKLPFLNVELPLVAFFFLAPLLFLITHANTLVHFVLRRRRQGGSTMNCASKFRIHPRIRKRRTRAATFSFNFLPALTTSARVASAACSRPSRGPRWSWDRSRFSCFCRFSSSRITISASRGRIASPFSPISCSSGGSGEKSSAVEATCGGGPHGNHGPRRYSRSFRPDSLFYSRGPS
jgi:hypothetical protein